MNRRSSVIKNLREREDYVIGYRPPRYIREKLADLLESGKFRELSELLNTALTEWLRDKELNTVYKKERQVK